MLGRREAVAVPPVFVCKYQTTKLAYIQIIFAILLDMYNASVHFVHVDSETYMARVKESELT